MEDLNNVPSTGTFGNSINQVNQNFGLVKGAIENLEGRTIRSKGLFPTQTALTAAYPSPKVGDYAYVGSGLPATIYDCLVEGTWHNTGQTGGSETIDLSAYSTTAQMNTAIDNGLQGQVGYAECNTDGYTQRKDVVVNGFKLLASGGALHIKMTNANTHENATMNISPTSTIVAANTKPLFYNGAQASPTNTWAGNEIISVYYDGTNYQATNSQGGGGKAEKIKYDNSQSGLVAENVQEALDEFGEVNKKLNIPMTSTVVTMPSTTVDGVMTDFTQTPPIWKAQSPRKLYFVPYTYREGDYLVVTANNDMDAAFVFLSSSNHVVGNPIDLAGNQSSLYTVPVGGSNAANPQKIPSDCTYILINGYYYSTYNYTPASVEIVNYQFVSDYAVEVNEHADNNTLLINTLASECQSKNIVHSYNTEAFVGQWTDGSIGTTASIRAHLKLPTIGYNKLRLVIPSNYYAQLYYVDSQNVRVATRLIEWQSGTITVDIDGEYDTMLNIKYQSAGTTKITDNMLAGVMWGVTLYNDEGYEPAAPYDELFAAVGGDIHIGHNEFVQGSNNVYGEIVRSLVRCITYQKYDVDANTIVTVNNNGQAHVMLTFDINGNYEGTTGWITANSSFTYTFTSAKKVQFVVSWNGGTSTSIVPDQVAVGITIHYKGRLGVLEESMGDSATTKANDSFCRFNKKISVYNPYKDHPQNQYKGQMHCHTTNSDGALAPAAVVAKYVGYGYDFMTITDHNYITPNPSPSADIVWMGNSYEDTWNAAGHQHMNVWNCTEIINKVNIYTTSNTPQMLVNHYVKNGDSVLSYNHPEYPAVYASDATLAGLPIGISFVEIYNSTIQTYLGEVDSLPSTANFGDMVTYNGTRYINTSITKASPNWKATTAEANPDGNLDRGFRIMLDNGHKVFCDAVDDFHRGDNMENRGWQMVFANSRTKQSIWNGLLMGSSYASTGVYLNDVSFIDGVFKLDIADGVNAVTTFYGYNNEVLGTTNGAIAMYEVTGDEKYVRAMVVIDGKKAWTQPIWIIAVGEQYEF